MWVLVFFLFTEYSLFGIQGFLYFFLELINIRVANSLEGHCRVLNKQKKLPRLSTQELEDITVTRGLQVHRDYRRPPWDKVLCNPYRVPSCRNPRHS